jgi:hypothetical protein
MKKFEQLSPKEINSQKRDLFITYRSNSQVHYKDISSFDYEHRIRLNPSGEAKTMDIRNQIPVSHIRDSFVKSELSCPKNNNQATAYEKAEIEEKINFHSINQKHQNLLRREKKIKNRCHKININIKQKFETRKQRLKNELTRIIKDALKFSKKNSAVRAMLPDNINDIVAQVKKETQDLSLNLSRISRISRVSSLGMNSILEKNDFLNSLGVDMENLNVNNVNIDIDKCWNYIVKIAKGKNVEDILRYKVVNIIMNLTEKKSAEKAKKIYEKLEIYKRYMKGKKMEEMRRKRMEEQKKEKVLKGNIKEYLKQKMYKSLSEPKMFGIDKNDKMKGVYGKKTSLKKRKKFKRAESTGITTTETNKKFKRLNAYNDVSKIINFIDNSKKNSQSKVCRDHFANIQITKNMDITLQKMIEKNDIFK